MPPSTAPPKPRQSPGSELDDARQRDADRAAAAVAEALDQRPGAAGAAIARAGVLACLLKERELGVALWLLRAGASRAASARAREESLGGRSSSSPPPSPTLPRGPPDEAVRAVARAIHSSASGWGAWYAREWKASSSGVASARAADGVRGRHEVRLPVSFALGLLAVVCALARLDSAFARRRLGGGGTRGRGRPRAGLAVCCGEVKFGVALEGCSPVRVAFSKGRLMAKENVEEFEDIVRECKEIISAFADEVVYRP